MNLRKISKTRARKLHTKGFTVYVYPSKVFHGTPWLSPMEIRPDLDFDKWIENFKYYNCNKELGNGVAYFEEVW